MNLLAGFTSSLEGEELLVWERGLVTWGSDCRLYGVLVFGEALVNFSGLLSVGSASLLNVVRTLGLVEVLDGGRLVLSKLELVLSCVASDDVIIGDVIGCIFCTCWLMAERSSCISLSCLPTLRM